MDDLAPAPAQRTSDDVGRTREESFTGRRKTVKKAPPAPVRTQELEPDLLPDPESEPESDHQIDLLA